MRKVPGEDVGETREKLLGGRRNWGLNDGARDRFGLGRCGNGGAVFGGDEAGMRGIQDGVGVGDVLGRRVHINWEDHERLGVGRFGLNGDLVRVVSFVHGDPAISPPNFGVEQTQEWVAEDNAEVGGYDTKKKRFGVAYWNVGELA